MDTHMIRLGDRVTINDWPHAGIWTVHSRHPRPGVVWLEPTEENSRGIARHAKYGMIGVSSRDLTRYIPQGDTLI